MLIPTRIILLICAVMLAAAGCAPPGEDEVQVIDLLHLLPPDGSLQIDEPRAPRVTWDFDQGLPPGWTAGPEGVKVVQLPGGIRLESPDGSPTWLEACATIDLLRYQKVLLAVAESLSARPATLLYSSENPPRYRAPNRVRVASVQLNGKQVFSFRLPTPDALEQPIRTLRLHTGAGGRSLVVQQLILQARKDRFLENHVLSRSRIGLGHEYRRCWRLAGNDERTVTLRLPREQPELRFALGTLQGQGPAELTVEVRQGGDPPESVSRQVFPLPRRGWQESRADLSPWRGEEVTLRFSIQGNTAQSVRLIGTPVVRTVNGPPRPSVLLIVLDAQRADRFPLYGHHRMTSPHLDRLAGEGILFSNPVAPSSWTIPSVAVTLTGRHPDPEEMARGQGGRLTGDTTLAQRFSRAGYATGGFSANCLLTRNKGFARGFDTWYVAPHLNAYPTAGELNRRALHWLRTQGREKTFCYIHYMDPHAPYDAPWPAPPDPGREPGGLAETPGWQQGHLWPLVIDGEEIGPAGIRQVGRLYERGSEYTDFQIGMLLAALRREGLLERTAVLVTADHGEELHDHGYWSHGSTLYQEMLHVPLVLRLPQPGPEAGSVVHTPVSLVDVAPTLAAIAGLPDAKGWSDGRDMRRLPDERTLYSFTTSHAPLRFAVIQAPWKYIYFNREAFGDDRPKSAQGRWLKNQGPPAESLFNLDDDPGERQNLMGQHPEIEAGMRGEMMSLFDETVPGLFDSAPQETEALGEEELERLRALGYVQ